MTLEGVLREAKHRQKTLVYHAPEPGEFAEQFDDWNVDVTFRRVPPDGPEPFVTVYEDGEFRAGITVSALRAFLDPQITPFHSRDALPDADRVVYDLLDDTVFASLNRRQLLAVSLEMEYRAWQAARGELHTGFQTWAAFEAHQSAYRRLATETDIDVHVYVDSNSAPDDVADGPITVHESSHPEVGQYWFLVFDGGDTNQHSTLVAEQRGENTYRGGWTYDRNLLAAALATIADFQTE